MGTETLCQREILTQILSLRELLFHECYSMHTVQCIPFDRRRIHFEFFRLTSLIRPAEVYPPDSFGTFMVHQNNSLEWFIGMMRVIHFEWFMCLMKRHAKTILSILILQFEPWEPWEPCKRQAQCIHTAVYTLQCTTTPGTPGGSRSSRV